MSDSAKTRDARVLEIYERLLEMEQRLIPTGLHIFGEAPDTEKAGDLLRMVASFDRPEHGVRSLPDLVAESIGVPPYRTLLAEPERMAERERVEYLVREVIAEFLVLGAEAASTGLERCCGVAAGDSRPVLDYLATIRDKLSVNQEIDQLMRGLRGEYIPPGPGADIVQNPGILPTGRNTHAVNPYAIPSIAAFQRSQPLVATLLEKHRAAHGKLPETIGMVLWGMDNIKTQGEGVAQALWLLGVAPVRDAMNRVASVEPIPLAKLGRPRIDVVMTVSGIFRDLFGATMELLDIAARKVAALDEPIESNYPRKHLLEQIAEGASEEDAAVRVFSNAAGNYGTNVNFMVGDSQWEGTDELGDLFVTRKCFAFGRGVEGRQARELMDRALARVEATYQNLDNSEVGVTDVDHYFEYLGGLTQAVTKRSGARPAMYMADTNAPLGKIRTLEETVELETRTKTLNPKWYEGMLKHGYRGVAEIEQHVSNTFGWSATAGAVDDWVYEEITETYVKDREMLERLRKLNPHAALGLVSRLLEAANRGLWQASPESIAELEQAHSAVEDQLEGVTSQ